MNGEKKSIKIIFFIIQNIRYAIILWKLCKILDLFNQFRYTYIQNESIQRFKKKNTLVWKRV